MISAAPSVIRPVLDELSSGPVLVLVTGGAGTGKTTALAALRDALGGRPDAAVVDDAHLLDGAELQRLTRLAGQPGTTLVVAAEPRDHDPDLRALTAALECNRPRLALGPMQPAEVVELVGPDIAEATLAGTAGLPFLVAAVARAKPPAAADVGRVAFRALLDRLHRFDERDLETLLIATLSVELGAADLAAALALPGDTAFGLFDRVRGTGLADPALASTFRDTVHRAAAQALGTSRHHEIESALLRTQLEMSALTPDLALRLAEHGLRDERLTGPLRARAAMQRDDPPQRTRTLRAALDCGATDLRADLADALAVSGDCAAATLLSDELLAAAAPADRAAGVRVAAAVAAHDGSYRQAAGLFDWFGPYPDAAVGAAAVTSYVATGNAAAAAAALAAGHTGPPTAAARTARTLAEGLVATLTRPYPVAAATLGQAAADPAIPLAMPDSPVALATLLALHNGDAARARSAIARDVASPRHRLLHGWVRMQEGRLADAATAAAESGLHRRDALWAGALNTAIARRQGDAGALQQHWNAAMDTLAECAIDLYSLLPLGELWMAAARLRQLPRLAAALDQARDLLAAMGNPPAWTAPLHWAGMQAGMLANDPAAVVPHAQALAAASAHSPFAATLAAAGRTWLRVLAGQVDDDVVVAARSLARAGLTSDATRLAGAAALSAADPKTSALMLQTARDLKAPADGATIAARPPSAAAAARPPSAALSDREREVAELLLLGMPYRDIGAQLFISAKTVEHHVARIRRRLGAGSRSEMLSMLRTILAGGARPEEG